MWWGREIIFLISADFLVPSSQLANRSETQFKVVLSKTKLFGALAFSMQAKAMDVGPYTHEARGKID